MSEYLVNDFSPPSFRHGKWIAPANSENIENFFFRAKTEFELNEVPQEAILHISAESYYILYVNGIETGRGPARGTHTHNYYDSYETAPLLRPGKNIIAVIVQCMNYDTFIAAPSQPGLFLELNGITASNSNWQVSPAKDWRQDVESFSVQVGYSEWRDMRLEPLGWTLGEDSAEWEPAWEIPKSSKIYSKELLPRDIPALKEKTLYPADIAAVAAVPQPDDLDSIKISDILYQEAHTAPGKNRIKNLTALMDSQKGSALIEAKSDNSGLSIIFDFEAELAGRFELELSAPEGCVVDICYNESMTGDRLAIKHSQESYHFADRYILREGRQKIGNTVYDRGFKMVQVVIRNFKSSVEIHQVKAIDNRYPFVKRASFNSDDLLLNRIWDVCCETLESCTTDIFTDCPWRERSFWVNDLIVENRTSLQAFGASELHRRAFRMALSEAGEGGLIPGVCPCPEKETWLTLIPTNLFIILMLQDYVLFSNDNALAKELMPDIVRILDTFGSWEDENGLLVPPEKYWNFFDWGFELNDISLNGKNTSLLNYLYIMALKSTIELSKTSGLEVDCKKYEEKIKKLSGLLEVCFFKENTKRLADYLENGELSEQSSQLAHAFAILSAESSSANREYFEDALTDENIIMPELYLNYFVFQAMKTCGKEDKAIERIRKYWGDIVKTGTPTIWEAGIHEHGKDAFAGDGSLCHGFATAPIDFFQTTILGVRPLSPGFERFEFAPVSLDLNFAEGRVPTPNGNIFVRWEKEQDELNIELRIPEGTSAVTPDGKVYSTGHHNFKLNIKGN